jgi:hypothetical protein
VLLLLLLLIVYELGYLCGALELVLLYIYVYICDDWCCSLSLIIKIITRMSVAQQVSNSSHENGGHEAQGVVMRW